MAIEATKLHLNIGDVLQFHFLNDELKRRYSAKLIGYVHSKTLLVTTPIIDGKVILAREGQSVVARMLSGNNIYCFTTKIACACTRPYAYLHLNYPRDMEKIVVRNAVRANTEIPVAVFKMDPSDEQETKPYRGTIKDISTSGAMLCSEHNFGKAGDQITIRIRFSIANITEELNLTSVIRNVRRNADAEGQVKYCLGIEFQLLDQHETILIHGFVYEQILKSQE